MLLSCAMTLQKLPSATVKAAGTAEDSNGRGEFGTGAADLLEGRQAGQPIANKGDS